MRRFLLILLTAVAFFGFISEDTFARQRRNSSTVRRERTRNNREQERTRRQIRVNEEETERQLNRLSLLEGRIEIDDRNIAALQARVDSINTRVNILTDSVEAIGLRVESLDRSYRRSLVAVRRQRKTASPAAFIFSSETFEQAWRRLRYLRELADWNREKGRLLRIERRRLDETRQRLDSTRAGLSANLDELRASRSRLEAQRAEADSLVQSLRSQAGNLARILRRQQELNRRLDDELNRLIAAEEEERRAAEEARRRAEEEARRQAEAEAARRRAEAARRDSSGQASSSRRPAETPVPTPVQTPVQPSGEDLTASFLASRGRLPMPVSGQATIVGNFGRSTHAELSRVEVQNNGIDIEATPGAKACAVFPGTVSMVILMEGFHNVVLVRHGEYLTVYAGLATLDVRKGQQVAVGQALGTVYSNPADDNRTRLHFEVRHEKDKLDPRQWLR